MSILDPFAPPGMGTASEETTREFQWGHIQSWQIVGGEIISTATDSGSTPTTTLRRGLLMGIVTASKLWKPWSATATDGSQVVKGVLFQAVNMLDTAGSAAQKVGRFVVCGMVKAAALLTIDALARSQMRERFVFDDDYPGYWSPEWLTEVAKTADYTVTAADRGVLFTNTGAAGAVNFTLPTLAAGLKFGFNVRADQNVTVTSAAGDDMVVPNDASADSVAFSTAGDKIGAFVVVYSNPGATKWIVEKRCSNAMTIAT